MAYDNERVQKALLALFQSELGAALDAVEALWSATDAVTLPDPESWEEGYKPTAVELPTSALPYVEVTAYERRPANRSDQWGRQEVEIDASVTFLLADDSDVTASKKGHRYLEALIAVLQANPRLSTANGYYKQQGYEAGTSLTLLGRHPKYDMSRQGADMFDPSQEDWLVGGSVETVWRG